MATAVQQINRRQLQREFIAASGYYRGPRRLPQAPTDDEATGFKINSDTYAQIACDPEAAAALQLLVYFVLADGVQLSPAVAKPVNGEQDAQYDLAVEIKEHLDRTLCSLQRPLSETLEMILRDALTFGNKVAEKTYVIPTDGPDAMRLVLRSVKPKPRGSISFVVDEFLNLLGIVSSRTTLDVIPAEKFVVATFRPCDDDPRGQSIFRPVVKAWNVKQLTWPEFLTYLMRCAVPGLVSILSERAKDRIETDDDGNVVTDDVTGQPKVISAAEEMRAALAEFRNSTALVVEHGTEIEPLEVGEGTAVFDNAIALVNREIRKGILLQELATADSEHQTKGATSSQMDIVDLLVWSIKRWVAESIIRRQICQPQVEYNFGAQIAQELTPYVALGDYERKDWAEDATAVVALCTATATDEAGSTVPLLTYSQIQSLLAQIGLPAPTEQEVEAMRQRAQERQQQREQGEMRERQTEDEDEEEAA